MSTLGNDLMPLFGRRFGAHFGGRQSVRCGALRKAQGRREGRRRRDRFHPGRSVRSRRRRTQRQRGGGDRRGCFCRDWRRCVGSRVRGRRSDGGIGGHRALVRRRFGRFADGGRRGERLGREGIGGRLEAGARPRAHRSGGLQRSCRDMREEVAHRPVMLR